MYFYFETGKHLFNNKKLGEAIEVFSKALDIWPSNNLIKNDLLYDRARANSEIGNFRDAANDCSAALKTNPNNTKFLLVRAECNDNLEDFEAAVKDYEAICGITKVMKPNWKNKRNKQNGLMADDIFTKLETAREKMKRKQAECKNTDADEKFQQQNYRLAVKLYTEAIGMRPENIASYRGRSACFIQLGDFKQALHDCNHIATANKCNAMDLQNLILCCLVLGNYNEAEKTIAKLLKIGSFENACDACKHQVVNLRNYEELLLEYYEAERYLSAGKSIWLNENF